MTRWTNSLEALGRSTGTDKSTIEHDFLGFYEDELICYRDRRFVLIEIGVKRGASLQMWAKWFHSAIIVGIDIDEEADFIERPPNAHVRIGNAADPAFLDSVVVEFGRPTIVVDDGSHVWPHQMIALQHLFPTIKAGGCFIMEDLHTSFPSLARDYRHGGDTNPFEYLIKLNRWIVGNRFMGDEVPDDQFIASSWQMISSIHFSRGTCVLHKAGV